VEPNIKVHVLKLMDRLNETCQCGPVDLAKWFSCFSFDVPVSFKLGFLIDRLVAIYRLEKVFKRWIRRIIGIYLTQLGKL